MYVCPPTPHLTSPPQTSKRQISDTAQRYQGVDRHIDDLHATIQSLTASKVGDGEGRGGGHRGLKLSTLRPAFIDAALHLQVTTFAVFYVFHICLGSAPLKKILLYSIIFFFWY